MKLRVAVLSLLLVAGVAQAQISTVPAATAGQPFALQIATSKPSCEERTNPRLFIDGKNVYLTFDVLNTCAFEASTAPWNVSIAMPGLAAGTYHVQVRLLLYTGISIPFVADFTVAGPAPGIEISPTFDTKAGNRVVKIHGSFPCAMSCPAPTVLFGSKPSDSVERVSDSEVDAVAPSQTNARFVDVTVKGDNYAYVLPSGFTYVDVSEYEPVLAPVYARHQLPGAFGSVWQTELRLLNRSQIALAPGVDVLYANSDLPMSRIATPAMTLPRGDVDSPPVAMAFVRKEVAPFVAFQLRVRDLSRQSESWGTDVPVVRGDQFKTNLDLLDVPVRPSFRTTFRVYSAAYAGAGTVMATLFDPASGAVMGQRGITLNYPNGAIGGLVPPPYVREGSREFPLQPAYAEYDLGSFPELAGHEAVWIELTSNNPIWAIASVTNEATQEVTVVSPR